MKDHGSGHGGCVRQVEGLRRYAHDLLAENERLRREIAQLEADRGRLAAAARQLDGALGDNAALHAENDALRARRDVLTEQLAHFREQAESQTHRQIELESRLQDIEEANRRFSGDYLRIEHENANLANLYVASYRLHGTAERDEVVLAIQEIIANLIGSEEVAIFEREADGAELSLVGAFGVDPAPLRHITPGAGVIGQTASRGEIYIRGEGDGAGASAEGSPVTACIPLTLDGRVVGVIAIFRLLPQKRALGAADHELFGLLSSQAAMALYCTRLHLWYGAWRAGDPPCGRDGRRQVEQIKEGAR